ncbi:MAG: hypothetical protein ACRDI0_06370 [Actinomycetota bacterium]
MATVEYRGEPNGLAAMIGGLIEANLSQHPEREALLRPAVIGIEASDADVALTLRLSPAGVQVANGIVGRPGVVVRADSETLADLTSVPLRFGFPDVMTAEGRAVTAKLLRRHLTVKGLLTRPAVVSRLNRLLSVA